MTRMIVEFLRELSSKQESKLVGYLDRHQVQTSYLVDGELTLVFHVSINLLDMVGPWGDDTEQVL